LANHGFGPNPRLEYGALRHFSKAAASEPELSTVLRQIGRHTGPQTRPDAKSHWKARMRRAISDLQDSDIVLLGS